MKASFTEIEETWQEKEMELKNAYELLQVEKEAQELVKKEKDEVIENINSIQNRIAQLENQITFKEEEVYDESQLTFNKREVAKLTQHILALTKQKDECLQLVESLQFWKAAYSPSGIPSMLIDDSIPFMNERVALYLDKLTNGRYVVSFDTLSATKAGEFRDKISVNVLDTFTRANSRVQLSGGQTRIIDIATILTLGDLQSKVQHIKFNLLIFDEIFDSLDDENIGYVSKVLSKLKLGRSIYLISHRHEDQLEADEVLAMSRK
jgi:exonuclease SbcC